MSRASRMAKEGTSCQQLILARGNSARELCAGQLVASRAGVVTAGGITCFGLVVVVRQHTPVSGSGELGAWLQRGTGCSRWLSWDTQRNLSCHGGVIELLNESNCPHTSEAELQRQKLSMSGRYHTAGGKVPHCWREGTTDAGCSMAGSYVQPETWTPAARAACAMAWRYGD
jgi:hypothetical protein